MAGGNDASRPQHAAAREALLADADPQDHVDAERRRRLDGEWLNYAAILVQVDRIAADLAGDS